MIVRRGCDKDIPSIVDSAVSLASENYPNDTPSWAHIADVVDAALTGEASIVAVMETGGGQYAGCYIGASVANLISGTPVAIEVMFVVSPEFRGHGKRLLKYAEAWARGRGCATMFLARPSSADRAGKVFQSWGYELAELHYRKVL